jgi:hypothetical protein
MYPQCRAGPGAWSSLFPRTDSDAVNKLLGCGRIHARLCSPGRAGPSTAGPRRRAPSHLLQLPRADPDSDDSDA